MKFLKGTLLNQSIKIVGFLALFLSPIFIHTTCTLAGHQPKCPNELLK